MHSRQTLESAPRAASPTYQAGDDSVGDLALDPELLKIQQAIRTGPQLNRSTSGGHGGGPEVVTIKIKWLPHPKDDSPQPKVWGYTMNRVRFITERATSYINVGI